jgi:hypothetical protein
MNIQRLRTFVIGALVAQITACTHEQADVDLDYLYVNTCEYRCRHGACPSGQKCECPSRGEPSPARPRCRLCYEGHAEDSDVTLRSVPCEP